MQFQLQWVIQIKVVLYSISGLWATDRYKHNQALSRSLMHLHLLQDRVHTTWMNELPLRPRELTHTFSLFKELQWFLFKVGNPSAEEKNTFTKTVDVGQILTVRFSVPNWISKHLICAINHKSFWNNKEDLLSSTSSLSLSFSSCLFHFFHLLLIFSTFLFFSFSPRSWEISKSCSRVTMETGFPSTQI